MNPVNVSPFNVITILPTLFLLIWIGIALVNAINPRLMWRITDSWKATKEPPESYFLFRRIIGTIFTIIGLGFLLSFL